MFNLEVKKNWWAYFSCSVSAIEALIYRHGNTFYNGVLAMRSFKNHYGDHYDEDGLKALNVCFTSLTASSIYIGDALGSDIRPYQRQERAKDYFSVRGRLHSRWRHHASCRHHLRGS